MNNTDSTFQRLRSSSPMAARSNRRRTKHAPLCGIGTLLAFLLALQASAVSAQGVRWSLEPMTAAAPTPDGLAQSWPVRLSPQLIQQNAEQIEITLPDGRTVVALRESWTEDAIAATWRGRVLGAPEHLSMALLTVADNRIAGVIETEEAQYAIAPRVGGHEVERSTSSRGECSGGVTPPTDLVGVPAAINEGLVGVEQEAGQPVVRVLVLFTPDGAGVVGGGINAAAASAVAYLNASIDNAGVRGSARLAGAEVIDTLGGANGLDPFLERLRLDPTVAQRRAANSADVVQLFVGFAEAGGGCGLGYLMGRGGNSRNFAPWAFGASSIRCSPDSTMAHEVGHNLGLNHNPEDSDFSRPFHDWSYGHRDSDTNSKTVMSYGGQRTVPYFSNPSVTTGAGFVTGVAGERDNARTLGTTLSIASGFFGTAQTPTIPPPTGLSATLVSAASAQLNWTDPGESETGFRIEQSVNGGGWQFAANVGANETSALIDGLPAGSEIRFRVRTLIGQDRSNPSNVARVETSAASRAPTTLTATPISDTSIELAWMAADPPGTSTSRLLIEARSMNHEYQVVGEIPSFNDGTEGAYTVSDLDPETAYTFRTVVLPEGETVPESVGGTASATTIGYDGPCREDDRSLCLLGERFEVRVAWRNQNQEGDVGTGKAIPIDGSEESGMFWFFREENVELVVKMLDATGFTQTYWQFYGALSDVEYWVSIRDVTNGKSRTYHNPPNNICGVGDINAFPADVAETGSGFTSSELRARWQPPVALDLTRPLPGLAISNGTGTCVPDTNTLCFAQGRFAVSVDFTVTQPAVETRPAITLPALGTPDTGFFWFFTETNLELAIKILDGRGINQRFWLFYGALSDVEYEVTITDTTNGEIFTINNEAGTQCGGADIETLGAPIEG